MHHVIRFPECGIFREPVANHSMLSNGELSWVSHSIFDRSIILAYQTSTFRSGRPNLSDTCRL